MLNIESIFVFNGHNSNFSSAVFSSFDQAKYWIKSHELNGTLTEYPIDYPIYNWAIDKGFFTPKSENQKSSKFIASFSSAYQKHWHFTKRFCEE